MSFHGLITLSPWNQMISAIQHLSINLLVTNLGSCQVWGVVMEFLWRLPYDCFLCSGHRCKQLPVYSIKMLNFVINRGSAHTQYAFLVKFGVGVVLTLRYSRRYTVVPIIFICISLVCTVLIILLCDYFLSSYFHWWSVCSCLLSAFSHTLL